MENPVIITVRFLFEGGKAWGNMLEFESDLKDFLGAYGKDAIVVRNIEGAPSGDIFLIVQTIDQTGMEQFINKEKERIAPSPRTTLNKLEKSISSGQAIKPKGRGK